MKKQNRIQPLQLSRETLRQLDAPKLAVVQGGFTEWNTTILSDAAHCVNS